MKDKQCTKIIGLTMTSESVKQIANDLFDLFGFMCAFEGERFQTERNRMAESCRGEGRRKRESRRLVEEESNQDWLEVRSLIQEPQLKC